jgi:hypothetical protein
MTAAAAIVETSTGRWPALGTSRLDEVCEKVKGIIAHRVTGLVHIIETCNPVLSLPQAFEKR